MSLDNRKEGPENRRRRNFLQNLLILSIGGGFVGAIGETGWRFRKEILKTLGFGVVENREQILLPQFSLRKLRPGEELFIEDPQNPPQLLRSESFIKIDQAKFRQEYLAASSTDSKIDVINKFVDDCIQQLDTDGVTRYLKGIPESQIDIAAFGLLNLFLIKQNGLFLDLDRNESFLNIWTIKEIEKLAILFPGHNSEGVVLNLKHCLFSDSEIPQKRFEEGGRFEPFPGIIVVFPDNSDYAKMDPARQSLAKKEGFDPNNPEHRDEGLRAAKYHEGSHALLHKIFRFSSLAMSERRTTPVQLEIPFGNGVIWKLSDDVNPFLADEMCGVAIDLIHAPHGNLRHLFTLFTNQRRLRQYSFATEYVLNAFVATPGLPGHYKRKIENGLQKGAVALQYEEIQAIFEHPSISQHRIQEIAQGMWQAGFALLQKMEANFKEFYK